ncbi:MAG: tetratricopeptide repeat protein [Candidatus Marinimicrobia bacterium]|nr:tetratricopeptide repeat protein [Candidatus Neomarinimicrobiota bacterium]MCF7923409.1 tetratricopeptide repeat protein [Candidatus Neomarinimicrobiota bacterium]
MLTPKKKLTKKELKHDPLLDTIEKGKEFYEDNSKQIMSGVIALLVIAVLAWGWMNNRETTRNEAMLANTKATLAAMGGFNDNVLAELERVVNEYGNNKAISQTAYQLGVARLEAGDLPGARELFSPLAKSQDKQTKIAGKLKLAYISEKEADYAKAIALYNEVGAMGDGLVSDYATLQAGYALVSAGNKAQAGKIVTKLLGQKPTGKFLEQVKYLEGKVLEK